MERCDDDAKEDPMTHTIERQPDPKGDRVRLILSGKFLPYKES
jgi:cyanate lyase